MRTALFGTPSDLTALLDGGLDPNSVTAGGTTLLMAASWDPEKVRLLLARGASAGTRAASGADALAVASQVPGNAESMRLLLDAGAAAEPPDTAKVRRTPLVLASRSGDVSMTSLLLTRGAQPSTEAVAEAVTFGYADVTRALVRAGVNVSFTEASGVNLLHWAVITNRASVVPVLVEAGVPVDDVDGFDFTPLMYAVTLDQGDTDTLDAVLRAHPDRTIRNDAGRTPMQQARRLGRTRAVRALTAPTTP
jgi:ankyrin repeat protein